MTVAFYDVFVANGLDIKVLPYTKLNEETSAISTVVQQRLLYRGDSHDYNDCDDPVLMTKWFDYLFTEEGSLLGSYGIENQAHTIVDGKPVFTDLIMNNLITSHLEMRRMRTHSQLMPFLVMTEREVDTFSEEQ